MSEAKTPHVSSFQPGDTILGSFVLQELIEPEQAAVGAPAVWYADSPGASFLAKVWSSGGAHDLALKTIWNHEVRNLLRLEAMPRAREYFAALEALGGDNSGYYVVVDGGGRHLLAEALGYRNGHDWLRRVEQSPRRAKLWSGLGRVATALEMLHSQGILHRGLRPGCVFTDLRGECDFRLSGFEWSLRLTVDATLTTSDSLIGRLHAPELDTEAPSHSMASDWFDFGLLSAEIFGFVPVGRGLEAIDNLRNRVQAASFLSETERSLLDGLLTPNPDVRRFHCNAVPGRVLAIATRLSAEASVRERPLLLAIHLTPTNELTNAIFELSGGRIPMTDTEGQMTFIKDDIAQGSLITIRSGRSPHYVLHGRAINYRVYPFEPRGGQPTWRAGFCGGVERGSRDSSRTVPLEGRKVVVGTQRAIDAAMRNPGMASAPWTAVAPFESLPEDEPGRDVHDFLRFTNTIDALLVTARIWPVEVLETGRLPDKQRPFVRLRASPDEQREALARALGLEIPARQMEKAFFEEIGEVDGETRFHLLDEARLSRAGSNEAEWTIHSTTIDTDGGRTYIFEQVGGMTRPPQGTAYLRPAGLGGSYSLLERRLAAIEALRDQTAMLRAIEAPGSALRDTMEIFPEDKETAKLDEAKQSALRSIWRCQPLYALQGPPGTGKTTLVETLLRRALEADGSLQIAATAQSNTTVDGLGAKLSKTLANGQFEEPPLVIRMDEDDRDDDERSATSAIEVAEQFARTLATSDLARLAPPHISRRIQDLAASDTLEGRRERKDLVRLATRAANIVLSTTTSRSLSDLVTEGKRFDWCLVEEAGKAHGFDLALPMLASHRMLLIGDHEQLPAFNEEAYIRLLANPAYVEAAIRTGSSLVPRKFRFDLGPVDGADAQGALEERCARWLPFTRFFGRVTEEGLGLVGDVALAGRLTKQHRMHPHICDLIQACFYPDLRTAESSRARLEGPDPFHLINGSWLPEERIVFVDMPYVQSGRNARGQDVDKHGRKLLSSRAEAEAVFRVLQQIRAHEGCTVRVLAPYRRQVRVVTQAIERGFRRLPLSLSEDAWPRPIPGIVTTIDAAQGEEADIVVISLTRNNDSAPTGGVGFLSERPRLNVMLSRAKRKLVLVGSWDFFMRRATQEAFTSAEHPMHHLAVVFHELQTAVDRGIAVRVPFDLGRHR